jgi:DNA uptake protein ComE-like DNA-binding protein
MTVKKIVKQTVRHSFAPRFYHLALLVAFGTALTALTACNNNQKTAQQEDADIQQKSADAAAQIKADAQKAEAAAKPALATAERRLDDVAAGVQQGIQGGNADVAPPKPSAGRLDVNSATADELSTLPGISNARANAIVAGRPYATLHQLVRKGIVTPAEYQRISGSLTAR